MICIKPQFGSPTDSLQSNYTARHAARKWAYVPNVPFGTKQTCRSVAWTSAFGDKADIAR